MWREKQSPGEHASDFVPQRAVRRRTENNANDASADPGPRSASATPIPMFFPSIGHCREGHVQKVSAGGRGRSASLLHAGPAGGQSGSAHLNWQHRTDPSGDPDPDPDSHAEAPGSHWNRPPQVIMAAFYQGPSLGLAVYDALANEVSVLQCQDEVRGPLKFQMLQLAKLQVQPQLLIVSTKTDETMMLIAQAPYDSEYSHEYDNEVDGYGTDGLGGGAFEVRMERSTAFTYDRALRRLEKLYLRPAGSATDGLITGRSAGNGTQQQRQPLTATHGSAGRPGGFASQTEGSVAPGFLQNVLHIAGLVDLGQRQAVGALGALVGFILREGLASG
ncbi:hypothetical protein Vafri_18655, partial [Volvox africanus]